MFNNNKGFTLIEMLVVLLIISVLIILIVPGLSNRTNDVHVKGCDALVAVVQAQVDLYTLEKGQSPGELIDLVNHSYIKKDQTVCANDKELKYQGGKVTSPFNEK